MATIIEGGVWKLSEAAAERMVENGLITKCPHPAEWHIHEDEIEDPVYHRALRAPDWLGFATMGGAVRTAEEHVEVKDEEGSVVPTTPVSS